MTYRPPAGSFFEESARIREYWRDLAGCRGSLAEIVKIRVEEEINNGLHQGDICLLLDFPWRDRLGEPAMNGYGWVSVTVFAGGRVVTSEFAPHSLRAIG